MSENNFNAINIKFQYTLNNVEIKRFIKLDTDTSLENNFKNLQNINHFPTAIKEYYLYRNNQKKLLDKNKKVKDLELRANDLILIDFHINNNQSENAEHIQNVSSANLNDEINSNSNSNNIESPCFKKGKIILLVVSIIILFTIIISLIIIYYYKNRSKEKNVQNKIIEEDENKDKTYIPYTEQEIPLTSYFTLSYEKEELIVNKAYPSNRLFIFKGNQKTEMKIEGDSVDEKNST